MEKDKNTLKQLIVDRSEIDGILNDLVEVKKALECDDVDTAKSKLKKPIEVLEDDVNYMETYGECYPLDDIREFVKECLDEKLVPYMTVDGIFTSEYDNIVDQPVEGLLYDLNRDYGTLYTFFNQRTVNDLGMSVLVTHLLNERQELKGEIENLKIESEEKNGEY